MLKQSLLRNLCHCGWLIPAVLWLSGCWWGLNGTPKPPAQLPQSVQPHAVANRAITRLLVDVFWDESRKVRVHLAEEQANPPNADPWLDELMAALKQGLAQERHILLVTKKQAIREGDYVLTVKLSHENVLFLLRRLSVAREPLRIWQWQQPLNND